MFKDNYMVGMFKAGPICDTLTQHMLKLCTGGPCSRVGKVAEFQRS